MYKRFFSKGKHLSTTWFLIILAFVLTAWTTTYLIHSVTSGKIVQISKEKEAFVPNNQDNSAGTFAQTQQAGQTGQALQAQSGQTQTGLALSAGLAASAQGAAQKGQLQQSTDSQQSEPTQSSLPTDASFTADSPPSDNTPSDNSQKDNSQTDSSQTESPQTGNAEGMPSSPQSRDDTPSSRGEDLGTSGKTELLPWFGTVDRIFSIGTEATIIDVDTGLSVHVQRTYGYNHADCETLTAQDTAILKKIAGGSWNWDRRAVIVEVAGYRIAASIAPMPHAGRDDKPANVVADNLSGGYGRDVNLDSIKGNGMDGHFDVHFYQSRTHATNHVDPQHQAMVMKAYKSGQ